MDLLFIAMEDLAHVLMCSGTPDDCENCSAAQGRLNQYRDSGYPRPGEEYIIRTPKSKDPESLWVSGRKVLSIEPLHPKPVRYQQSSCKQTGRCTLEEWRKWAAKAEVIRVADADLRPLGREESRG